MASDKQTVTRLDSNYMQQYDAYIERQRRKKKRLIRRLVLFSLIAVIAIGTMATYHFKQRVLHAEKTEEYQALQKELTSLEKQEANLQEEVELLNDEDYVLQIARTNYFFSKEGELIFKLPDEKPSY
ncbi:septum formation initiator family protein [Virgibacillus sp. AGTR]|uniref:Septum formation initiator family protein n=2 Tax=Bacillaceae TaxID=186817 RepID=A0A941DYS9_9BACI|nr:MULTISPECIES: septum formation initiator family protein [Bacillaceae]NAZ10288.1 septum formation initiator family protein [Agaribacter marinus]MBR7797579.1 septum formation initiator family protein [Virgibacillus salarius]MCC2251855.1 septum formation initiator family protein [Virgibacillus sp. AGTR]MDY7046150.1 septum formation initiator family protein [Virgibacillus sp. M23]QRZ19104.1 septum formation initiator family protein [Virgibacillus sp. AGTR]